MTSIDREQLLEASKSAKEIVIYGAHLLAENLLYWLRYNGYEDKVKGFAVTSHESNPVEIQGHKVMDVEELKAYLGKTICFECTVIVAIPEKFWEQVSAKLKELNMAHIYYAGINGMTDILGDGKVDYINTNFSDLSAHKALDDFFCVDVWARDDKQKRMRFKMPVLTKIPIECTENKAEIELAIKDSCQRYAKLLSDGTIYDKGISVTCMREAGVSVYRVCSQFDQEIEQKKEEEEYWVKDIHAGAVLSKEKVCMITDDTGVNISDKNKQYAEMTAMYWAWKNDGLSVYKGLCHYRRGFKLNHRMLQRMIADDVAVIMTTPRVLNSSVREYFYETPVTEQVFGVLMEVLRELRQDYYEYARDYFESNVYFPNNMFVAKAAIFDEYCSYVFPILARLEEICEKKDILKKDRYVAYSAELLTSLFFDYHLDKWKTVCLDYYFRK